MESRWVASPTSYITLLILPDFSRKLRTQTGPGRRASRAAGTIGGVLDCLEDFPQLLGSQGCFRLAGSPCEAIRATVARETISDPADGSGLPRQFHWGPKSKEGV